MQSNTSSAAILSRFQSHPLREAVKGTGTLSPKEHAAVLASAADALIAHVSTMNLDSRRTEEVKRQHQLSNPPALAEPKASDGGDDVARGAAMLTQLMSALMAVVGQSSLDRLERNAALWNQLSQAAQQSLESLHKDMDDAVKAAEDAKNAASASDTAAKAAESAASAADSDADAAEAAYQKASQQKPAPANLQELKEAAESKRATANAKDADAKSKRSDADKEKSAAADTATKAAKAEKTANDAADQVMKQFGPRSPMAVNAANATLRGAAALTAVFAKLQELISDGNLKELDTKQKLFQEAQKERETFLQKKSAEYQEQVKKAEEMQKTMGCIGKILGFILAVVAVAAAVETGGASLALAAVGLALALGDEIIKDTTGFSFMDAAMKPIMDHILKPMMNFFAEQITKVLEACGVDKSKAQIAGAVLGAIATGAVLVAGAVCGMEAASSELVSQVAGAVVDAVVDTVSQLLDRLMPEMLTEGVTVAASAIAQVAREIAEAITTALADATDTIAEKLGPRFTAMMDRFSATFATETEEDAMLMANRMDKINLGLHLGNEAVQAAGSIVVGIEERDAMNTLATIKKAMADLKILSALIKEAVQVFGDRLRTLSQMMQEMSNASETEMSTGNAILRNARAV